MKYDRINHGPKRMDKKSLVQVLKDVKDNQLDVGEKSEYYKYRNGYSEN